MKRLRVINSNLKLLHLKKGCLMKIESKLMRTVTKMISAMDLGLRLRRDPEIQIRTRKMPKQISHLNSILRIYSLT